MYSSSHFENIFIFAKSSFDETDHCQKDIKGLLGKA